MNRWNERYINDDAPWDSVGIIHDTVKEIFLTAKDKTANIVEIGCGTGKHSLWIADNGFSITSTDISEKAIELAKNKTSNTNPNFIVDDFLTTKLEANSYDFMFDVNVFRSFESLQDRQIFVYNASKILKKGGYWLIILSKPSDKEEYSNIPRRSLEEIIESLTDYFVVENITDTTYPNFPLDFWNVLVKRID